MKRRTFLQFLGLASAAPMTVVAMPASTYHDLVCKLVKHQDDWSVGQMRSLQMELDAAYERNRKHYEGLGW